VSDLPRATAAMQRGMDEGAHVGALMHVRRGGEVVAEVAMGLARPGVDMTPATLMPWLSCTKPITAAAVLQQWERGALDLDAPVATYIAEFAANGKSAITIRHLLTHTGGFPTADGDLAEVCAAPLEPDWVPGHRAAYHPRGAFLVLGEVVHRLDGRQFDAYVSEELLEPLDMGDTWLALAPERYVAYGDRVGVLYNTSRRTRSRSAGSSRPTATRRFTRVEVESDPWASWPRSTPRWLAVGGACCRHPRSTTCGRAIVPDSSTRPSARSSTGASA
jgi:CubicO group peptidase (beta-lactamase class C family)